MNMDFGGIDVEAINGEIKSETKDMAMIFALRSVWIGGRRSLCRCLFRCFSNRT